MLEKSLPFFRQPKDPKDQNKDNSTETFGSGSNLLFLDRDAPYNAVHLRVLARMFLKLSYFIVFVFFIMLIANWVIDLKLQSQKIMLNKLSDEVGQYSLVRSQAIDLDKRIKFYAKTLSLRSVLGDKSEVIFSNLDNDIKLHSATVTIQNFALDFQVDSPLQFARLINRYLKSPLIGSITLKSADLHASDKTFKVIIEGTYSQ